eukprot:TRINITY_DN10579_c0_g1_i1.p1 TRINITY_DN10579_c0_g1~~TRINITY_DN10579_c0_g1_i1.p1  ORF type:complete len:324 (+),score=99.55 TRINITY_DN10579_c0_g1_i1:52-972(+)
MASALSRGFLRSLNVRHTCVPRQQTRGYPANLKALKRRRDTVTTVGKITATMKVVASSRLPAAQAKAEAVSPVFRGMKKVFEPLVETLRASEDTKTLLIVVCTDKGLCGSTNNGLTRMLLKEDLSKNQIIVWGEKGGPAFENSPFNEQVIFSAHPDMKTPVTFTEVGAVVDKIVDSTEYDLIRIVYNQMVGNSVAQISEIWLPSAAALGSPAGSQSLVDYTTEELSRDELLYKLHHFHLTASLNYANYQNMAVETFNRRNSMDNASKNADEVGQKLTILYNRVRQAAITTELCEITAGASAISEAN